MQRQGTTVERDGRSTIVRLRGDLTVPMVGELYTRLRGVARRRDVATVVLDFGGVDRIDSSGVAVVGLLRRQLAQSGKTLDLSDLQDQHRAALALAPEEVGAPGEPAQEPAPGTLERLGDHVLDLRRGLGAFADLAVDAVRQLAAVVARHTRIPPGAVRH